MLTVHHLENSRSQRVLWLLEELGLPYNVQRYDRDKQTMQAPSELLKVHPLRKSPIITDGDATVAETGAIVEYLVDQAGGRLRPIAGSPELLRYRYWLHFAEGTAMPPLVMKMVFDRVVSSPMPFFVRPVARGIASKVMAAMVAPNLSRQLDFMEAELKGRDWFAGNEFSAADVMMSFPLELSALGGGLDASRPRLQDLLQRIHARPAYRRALKRGGPYALVQQS